MEKVKAVASIGFLSWLILAFFTIVHLPNIWGRHCYFSASWLFCDADISPQKSMALFFLIAITFAGFCFYALKLWKAFMATEGELMRNSKFFLVIIPLLAFLVVPFGSGDMSYYFNVGRAVHTGINPYVEQWSTSNPFGFPPGEAKLTGVMYGPVVLYMFDLWYSLAAGNYLYFVILWKLTMFAFFVLCGWLVIKLIKTIAPASEQKNWYAFWLLQPLFLFEWVTNGHFDSIWISVLLLALWCATQKKWLLVWTLLTVGIWIKFLPALVVPWFLIWWWQDVATDWRKLAKGIAEGIGAVLFVSYIAWANFWTGFAVFKPIVLQSKWAVSSLFSIIYYSLLPLFTIVAPHNTHWYLTRVVHLVLAVLVVYLLYPLLKKFWFVLLKKEKFEYLEIIKAIFLTLFVYLFIWQKSIWPWYAAWLLPFGLILYGASKNQIIGKVLVWLSVSPFIFYLLWLPGWLVNRSDTTPKLWFFYCIVASIVAYPLFLIFKWRRSNYL